MRIDNQSLTAASDISASGIFHQLVLRHLEQFKNSEELPLLCCYSLVEQSAENTASANVLRKLRAQELPAYKAFKQVTVGRIAQLRARIDSDEIDSNVENWCEKLLRYSEIRYKQKHAKEQNKEQVAKLHMQIISMLIEYYFKSGDLRCINTALKLMDYKRTSYPQNESYLSTTVLYERNSALLEKILCCVENE